jgi:hypothetical protein
VNPIERLEVLERRLSVNKERMEDRKFHEEMLSIFRELRDRHTNYVLPRIYQQSVAFLPILIEVFYDRESGESKYMISKVADESIPASLYEDDTLAKQDFINNSMQDAIVTHWNGIPIDRVVELNAEFFAGTNEEARYARSVQRLTIRPLFNSLPPDEEWVTIQYEKERNGRPEVHRIRLKWQVRTEESEIEPEGEFTTTTRGIDGETELVRKLKRALFQSEKAIDEPLDFESMSEVRPKEQQNISLLNDVFRFRKLKDHNLGYIRIFTFDTNYIAILLEFARIMNIFLEKDVEGIIIDVRGNSGGSIPATDLLLQLLTTKQIKPQRFQFICTELTLKLCQNMLVELEESKEAGLWQDFAEEIYQAVYETWEKWAGSIDTAIKTGEQFSDSLPLAPAEVFKDVQGLDIQERYENRVLLITDALSYSAADMFAAGVQDNEVAPLLGTSGLTGGGGANTWFYPRLVSVLEGEPEGELEAQDPTFTIAVRRSIRVGKNAGKPLEDFGVTPKYVHRLTEKDLSPPPDGNKDLLDKAAEILYSRFYSMEEIQKTFMRVIRELPELNLNEESLKDAWMQLQKRGPELTASKKEIEELFKEMKDEGATIVELVNKNLPPKPEYPRAPTNEEITNAFSRAGQDLKPVTKPSQAAYIGPDIDHIPTLNDEQKQTIKKELEDTPLSDSTRPSYPST